MKMQGVAMRMHACAHAHACICAWSGVRACIFAWDGVHACVVCACMHTRLGWCVLCHVVGGRGFLLGDIEGD